MKKLVIVVVCCAVLSVLMVLAWTALSQVARPVAAGDSFLSVPACAFSDYENGYDFTKGHILNFDTGSGSFGAPVNLPNGSVIKKVVLICKDNGGSSIQLKLLRVPQSGGYDTLATVSSTGADFSYRAFGQKLTANKYVHTWKYSYLLFLTLPGTSSDGYYFSQAKVVYTPPSP